LLDLSAQLSAHPAAALPLLFVGGVLTSFTPCVYPMIPITAAIVGGQSMEEASGAVRRPRWRPQGYRSRTPKDSPPTPPPWRFAVVPADACTTLLISQTRLTPRLRQNRKP